METHSLTHSFFIEVLLEPETKFTVVLVEKDPNYSDVMRVVLNVKKSPPVLKDAIERFQKRVDEAERSKAYTAPLEQKPTKIFRKDND